MHVHCKVHRKHPPCSRCKPWRVGMEAKCCILTHICSTIQKHVVDEIIILVTKQQRPGDQAIRVQWRLWTQLWTATSAKNGWMVGMSECKRFVVGTELFIPQCRTVPERYRMTVPTVLFWNGMGTKCLCSHYLLQPFQNVLKHSDLPVWSG